MQSSLILSVVAWLLLAAGTLQAQQLPIIGEPAPAPADTAEAEPPRQPSPLEAGSLASAVADSAALALEAINQLGDTAAIAADLGEAAQREAELQALLASLSESDYVRPERISRLRDQAVLEEQRLEALRTRILERLAQLGALRDAWSERLQFWQRWQQQLQGDPELPNVLPDLQRAVEQIDAVLAATSTAAAPLLGLQRELDSLRSENTQLRTILVDIRERGREALFQQGQPLLLSPEHRAQVAAARREAWHPMERLQPEALVRFARSNGGVILFHIGLALVLGLVARRIGNASRKVGDWSGMLDHPWLLGVFASAVIAIQRVFLAPPLWDVLLWSVFGVAASILARRLLAAYALRLTVYIFSAFYPAFLLFEAAQLPAPLFRLALAAVAAIALPVFAWLAHRRTAVANVENVNDPRRIWPLRIGAMMWAVVLGAVVLGYDSLGRWVLHASLTSGAVVFVVAVLLALVHGAVSSLVVSDPTIRRRLALRVAVRLAQRLIFVLQALTMVLAALVLLDVWQLTESPVATWQRIVDTGFDVGPIRLTIGRILLGALVVYIAVLISWLVRNVVQSEIYGRWDFDRGVGESINKLVHYLLITVGVIVALAVLGVQLRNFAIIAGALGIGIGFGLQNVVSNFASGLILLFERPVRVGDTVVVGGEWGTITKIGLRSTVMLTFDQSEMIVPNADLVSEKVVNWTLSNPIARVIVSVGVAYGSDVDAVLRILQECALAHDQTLQEPPPLALFTEFGDSSLNFELRVWVAEIQRRLEVRSAILKEIDRRFADAGIEIPFPQRDLHVRSVDAAAARALGLPTS